MRPELDPFEIVFGKTRIHSPEMERLRKLLDEAGIPYTMRKGILGGDMLDYYGEPPAERSLLNVISDGYGYEEGLLEAMGMGWDSVGGLHADEVYDRIRQYREKDKE